MKGLVDGIETLIALGFGAWTRTDRLSSPGNGPPEKGFVLGDAIDEYQGSPPEKVVLAEAELRRHAYILGATGCGKTNLLLRLIEAEIEAKRTVVVLDLRGDLVDRILPKLVALDGATDRLNLIDLRSDKYVVGLNPLKGHGDVYGRALHLLGVIKHNAESWGIQLDETARNALIALAEAGWSLLEIEPLLCNHSFRTLVLGKVGDHHVRSFLERYDELSTDKQLAWSQPVLNKVTPLLAIPQLRRMFGSRSGLNWSTLLNKPGQIILISLAVDRFHAASHLVGGLCVSCIQNAIMARVDTPEKSRTPVTLFIDEFETMASPNFESIIAEGRRFGVSLVLSHQNLSQLPANLKHVLLNNVHVQLYFQTGSSDASELSREIVSDVSKEKVRVALLSQTTGEAFLIRRGQPSIQVLTYRCTDPHGDASAVAALRDMALQRLGRPIREVDRELDERRCDIAGQPSPGRQLKSEVRHERLPKQ